MKNGVFEIFDPIVALGGKLGGKPLLKRGFYPNFNNYFIRF